ncbi:MAG: Stk1 family PASTA domain-containing Ser/Thr kinase [Lachnospiraceae bacterium]|nr:Stk1 family PASTA domain-containing Ser/Thr kinase [Lachnospiraceae bacterium]
MIKIGMMIAERYEIIEKIGTGGMSDVYKAKDHKLNRLVAVKVLKQEFSENANFVSKFKVEAQAAAGLMHPNIVNVYDVGEESGINYIVMELVEGITLKKYIEKKARLSVREATSIAMQIALGIEAAHNKHIIHRDIKPQNVIVSNDGKVKVTDFGIAKAATSNTITSNVMGSVHYTSPEQARGGYSDEKSDIYSLGITLFEMLTGRVPFNGDTTVAIAIKQIQEKMPSPKEFVPEIPVSVEQIVLKCTQKSPDRRYQNMAELIADLRQSFITPDENFVTIQSDSEFGATILRNKDELEAVKKSTSGLTGELPRVNVEEDDSEYDRKMDKVTTVMVIVVGVLICVVGIFLIGKAVGLFNRSKTNTSVSVISVSEEKPEQVVMPGVTLKDYKKAIEILESVGLKAKVSWQESDKYEKDIVISTSVNEGLKVDKGAEVTIIVSSGLTSLIVPDVVGYSLNAANKAIINAKLKVEIVQEYSDDVAEGFVISQSHEGDEKVPVDSVVTIKVSLGKTEELLEVPDVKGLPHEDAVLTLIEKGFTIGSTDQVYNDVYAEGYICYQSVPGGSDAPKGTVIDIQVSRGPAPEVPETYSFSASILPPSVEDGEYSSGTPVTITIADNSGKVLKEFTTETFPYSINMSGFTSTPGGTITLKYTITVQGEPVTDPNTGEVTVPAGTTEERTLVREITFVKDE